MKTRVFERTKSNLLLLCAQICDCEEHGSEQLRIPYILYVDKLPHPSTISIFMLPHFPLYFKEIGKMRIMNLVQCYCTEAMSLT